jgi:hypothetical protein
MAGSDSMISGARGECPRFEKTAFYPMGRLLEGTHVNISKTTALTRGLLMLSILFGSTTVFGAPGGDFLPPQCVEPTRDVIVGDTASDPSCDYNDIQSAISSAFTNSQCETTVHVTREHLYTNQALVVDSSRNITLAGWGDGVTCADIRTNDCTIFGCTLPAAATNPLVTISGGSGSSVIHVDGNSNLSLLNLTITGGSVASDQKGGGIYFDGTGAVTLTSTTVSLNHAGYGAGININGDGGAASLTLNDYSQILVNTADASGGGIRLEGNARLYALKPHTLIGFNKALNGYGGGMEVLGPARADIGSPGFGGLPVIYSNDAEYGGGMDIETFNSDALATVRMFTTDPTQPVQLSDNFASHAGGAVYLISHSATFADNGVATFCAYDFRIEDNAAPEGAAIYADADFSEFGITVGGNVALNTNPASFDDSNAPLCSTPELPTALGATECASGVTCNELSGNIAEDQNNQPTSGAIILLQSDAELIADRFKMRNNTGAHLIREIGDDFTDAQITNCLLADNTLTAEVIALTDGDDADIRMDACTVAGNSVDAPYVFSAPGTFLLFNSIIDQPGRGTVDPAVTDGNSASHVLTNDKSSLPDTVYIEQGEPTFVNASTGDYHLLPSSLGVDDAPIDNTLPNTTDLDRNMRVVDLSDIANNFGPMDLGAYEIQSDGSPTCIVSDTIFCNGFEPGG